MGAALAIAASLQTAVLVVTGNRVLLQIDCPAQFTSGTGAVLNLVVAPGQGFADAIGLWIGAGGALQVGNGPAPNFRCISRGEAHAVVGTKTRIIRIETYCIGQPGNALFPFP
ncbi:hypothetical protein D3C80_1673210 [compost metagenome]